MTKIPYVEVTWNPLVGCSHISAGCTNCYAEAMARRLAAMSTNRPWLAHYKHVIGSDGKWNGNTALYSKILDLPGTWKKPRDIFVCSMGDLFHDTVTLNQNCAIFEAMFHYDQHNYFLFTKRPWNMKKFFERLDKMCAQMSEPGWSDMPNPNIAIGVSVSNQTDYDRFVPVLREIPASFKFVSVEPMLAPIKGNFEGIDWVIYGTESLGSKPGRPCEKDWMVQSVANAKINGGAKVYVKQFGLDGKLLKDISEMPFGLRYKETISEDMCRTYAGLNYRHN